MAGEYTEIGEGRVVYAESIAFGVVFAHVGADHHFPDDRSEFTSGEDDQ